MPNQFENVRPGDVITSDFMNQILARLEAMDQRITFLETKPPPGVQVEIERFEPPVQVEAGQLLTLVGSNFAFPPNGNIITIDGFTVPAGNIRADSTSTRLMFIVPTEINVPAGGRNYTIRVTTPTKRATTRGYRLLPALDVVGDPPVISSITRASDGSATLRIGEVARITGQNFAVNPTDNTITFTISTVTPAVTYPLPGQTLIIDLGNSNTEQILVTVPDIVQIAAETQAPVTVKVRVGVHPEAARVVSIRRPGV
ncbi:MAG: hypothetical protein GY792_29570 [Gammaproteobacteria bacterium]|nr:hypothetical protein [Gammaproteobacteria bacterium]